MKIGELARATGLTIDTLRYYEKIGLLPKSARDAGGRRHYDDLTLRWIEFLKRLKQTGMPLAEMILYAQWREAGDSTSAARRQLLEQHRQRILSARAALNESLAAIDTKIETYHALEAALNENSAATPAQETRHEQPHDQPHDHPHDHPVPRPAKGPKTA